MKVVTLLNTLDIVFIVASIILVLAVFGFILSKFAFRGTKNKKALKSLSIKYSYVRSLLLDVYKRQLLTCFVIIT